LDSTNEFVGGEFFDQDVVADEDGGRFGDASRVGFEEVGVDPGGVAIGDGRMDLAEGEEAAATPRPFGLGAFGEPKELRFVSEATGGGVLEKREVPPDKRDGVAERRNEVVVKQVLQTRTIGAF